MTLTGKTYLSDSSSSVPTGAAQAKKLRHKLLGGSLTLLAGSGLVGVTNLVYNVVTARLLGPTGFAHATAVYTLLMLASAITLSFQVVCAKYVAGYETPDDKAAIFAALHLRAWLCGIVIGSLIFIFNRPLMAYLNLPDPALISLLALGTAFYIPLGVRRGLADALRGDKAGLGRAGAIVAGLASVTCGYAAGVAGNARDRRRGVRGPASASVGASATAGAGASVGASAAAASAGAGAEGSSS